MIGERLQIHGARGEGGEIDVRIFSRNRHDVTAIYPDVRGIFERVLLQSKEVSFVILDAEVCAFNTASNLDEPFQALLKRPRTHVPEDIAERIPVRVYLFDCLWLNQAPLL